MVKNICVIFIYLFTFISFSLNSQNLIYKLKSRVVLRDWELSSKAFAHEKFLNGASIELFEGAKLLSKTTSDNEGNFELDLPSSGNFTVIINSPGYNSRKFSVNCNSIIIKNGEANFIPSVEMRGFIAYKAIKNVSDMGLSYPTVQMSDGKNNNLKYNGLKFNVNMLDGEMREIQKFCTCNKLGDIAMQNGNYALAKKYYLMASSIMENEEYPKEKLQRAEDGLKNKQYAQKSNAPKNYGKASKKKSITQTPTSVSTQSSGSQKSSSGGRKVLPVIGGKK